MYIRSWSECGLNCFAAVGLSCLALRREFHRTRPNNESPICRGSRRSDRIVDTRHLYDSSVSPCLLQSPPVVRRTGASDEFVSVGPNNRVREPERYELRKAVCNHQWLWRFFLARRHGPRALAADAVPTPTVSYFRDVRPIFQVHCQGCHQPAKAMGEFVMTNFEDLAKGGESEQPAVVPGKPDESNLLAQITPGRRQGRDAQGQGRRSPKTRSSGSASGSPKGPQDDTPMSVRAVIDAEHPPVYEASPVLTALDFSPDGSLLAVSGYHEVLLHKADGSGLVGAAGRPVGADRVGWRSRPTASRWPSPAARPAAWAKCRSGTSRRASSSYSLPVTYDTVYGASWSRDGTKIAFGCADNTLRAIDAADRQASALSGRPQRLGARHRVLQGRHVPDLGQPRPLDEADRSGHAAVRRQHHQHHARCAQGRAGRRSIAIRTKDELLIGGADGVPKIYQMLRTKARVIGDDFNLIKAYEAVPGRIYDVDFNADGSRFVVGSSLDGAGEVRVYETDSGKLLHKLEGQQGAVYAVAFSTSGKVVASAGFDGLVRLNDAETGKLIKEFAPVPISTDKVATAE